MNFYKEVYEQKWYWKGLLIGLLEESHKEYLQVSLQADSALTRHHEQMPQEPWRSRWLGERNIEQYAPTHACHTHCTSRQLATTADWRYDVPRDWLWVTCQMARVRWEARCKGFCCKELFNWTKCKEPTGMQTSAKSAWEIVQKLSSDKQQSTLIHKFGDHLGDSLPKLYCVDLVEAYITRESVSSRILSEKKRYDSPLPNWCSHEKPLANGRMGKENRY